MFVTYYSWKTDELYQSEVSEEVALRESKRVLWAPSFQKSSATRDLTLPLRPPPAVALRRYPGTVDRYTVDECS